MSDPYIGEVRLFSFNFPPRGWAFCNGQQLPINQNQALFSLLGTAYGGNGQTTFALPDMRGRAPIHAGTGGFSIGGSAGLEAVQLQTQNLPAHSHQLAALSTAGNQANVASGVPSTVGVGAGGATISIYATAANAPQVPLAPDSLSLTGDGGTHNNMQPFLVVSYCIALQGIFPPRA